MEQLAPKKYNALVEAYNGLQSTIQVLVSRLAGVFPPPLPDSPPIDQLTELVELILLEKGQADADLH